MVGGGGRCCPARARLAVACLLRAPHARRALDVMIDLVVAAAFAVDRGLIQAVKKHSAGRRRKAAFSCGRWQCARHLHAYAFTCLCVQPCHAAVRVNTHYRLTFTCLCPQYCRGGDACPLPAAGVR